MSDLPAAGWYDDPEVPGGLRWWDGDRWTDHRHAADGDTGKPDPTTATRVEDEIPDEATSEPDLTADPDEAEPTGEEPAPTTAADEPVVAPVEGEPAPWTGAAVASPSETTSTPTSALPPPVWTPPTTPMPAQAPAWGQPSWQPTPRPDRVSGKAAASLILSLLWLFGLASLAAIPLGILGRRDVAASGGDVDGAGMATAGIVIGVVGSLFGVLVLAAIV